MKFITEENQPESTTVVKCGMRFILMSKEYIVAQVAPAKFCLIDLDNGNRLTEMNSMEDICLQLNSRSFRLA